MKLIESSSLNKMRVSSLNNGYLIFDIFLLNNNLHIVGPATPNFDIDSLTVYYNNNKLFIKKYMYDFKGIEGFFFLIYECYGEPNITIDVKYKDDSKSFYISNEIVKEEFIHKLSITTLCFKDYEIFPMWHEYYKKQGIDHFYIYYNGGVDDTKKNFFDYDDVTLIEWPFKYWNPHKGKTTHHHAQPPQLQHSLYRFGKTYSEYMIFCDLDEYLQTHLGKEIPEGMKTIKEYLLENPSVDIISFRNLWSQTIDRKIPKSFPDNFLVAERITKETHRRKNLYRTRLINAIQVHNIHFKWNKQKKFVHKTCMFFHFCNWSRHDRNKDDKKFSLLKQDDSLSKQDDSLSKQDDKKETLLVQN